MRRIRAVFVCCSLSAVLAVPATAQTSGSSSPQRPAPAVAATAPLGSIVTDTLIDFSRLASWETVSILSAGGAGAAVARAVDADVTREFSGSGRLGTIFHAGETIGSARMQLAGAVATYATGKVLRSPRVSAVGADLIRANLVTQALTAGIKLSVGRTRPDQTQFSFPSGHSSVSFATATVVQRHFGWKAGIPAYAMATYVAASRVQVRRHFLSDVTFGAAVGIVAGRTVTIGRGKATFAVAPAPAPGGAAVRFTLLQRQ